MSKDLTTMNKDIVEFPDRIIHKHIHVYARDTIKINISSYLH